MHAGKIEQNLRANGKHIMGTDNNIKNGDIADKGNKSETCTRVLSGCNTFYLSIGSNVGDREANIRKAVDAIDRHPDINVTAVSSIYKTDPMYVKNQDYFYNIVLSALIRKTFSPFELLGFLKKVEYDDMGRKKAHARYGPRIIDIDILYCSDVCIDSSCLTIPHPKLAERNFVLVPLGEISPDFMVGGKNIKEFIVESNFPERVDLVRSW